MLLSFISLMRSHKTLCEINEGERVEGNNNV
jgi:hypothetical protein